MTIRPQTHWQLAGLAVAIQRMSVPVFATFVVLLIVGWLVIPTCVLQSHGPSVSRTRADLRSLASAIECYFADHSAWPVMKPMQAGLDPRGLRRLAGGRGTNLSTIESGRAGLAGLTTPIAFIAQPFPDPFAPVSGLPFAYYTDGHGWIVFSPGRDGKYDIVPERDYDGSIPQPSPRLLLLSYDPTNGTVSAGDVWRVKY